MEWCLQPLYLSFFISENLDTVCYVVFIIFIVVFGGLALVNCYDLFTLKISQKIILTEDYIQIQAFYILFCLNKNEIYNYMNIKSFQVEKEKVKYEDRDVVHYHIICLDIFNQKKNILIYNCFGLEEAEYFVYVVNGFINKKKNMITIS